MSEKRTLRLLVPVAMLLTLAATVSAQWVEDSIDVGGRWVGNLAYNCREGVVHGASEDGPVFAIDCSTNQVVSSFNALGPGSVAYCSTENKAYCMAADTVLVIDGSSHTRLRSLYLEWATRCVWDGVSNRLYVTLDGEDEVAVLDCVTDSVIDRIRVGRGPVDLYLSTRHRKLYVLNNDSESISIVNIETNEVLNTVRPGNVPGVGCFSHAADKFYCGAGGALVAVDGAADTVLVELELPGECVSLTAVESESLVMAGTYYADSVFVVDARADTFVNSLYTGVMPEALEWSPLTGVVYCANGLSCSVSAVAEDGTQVIQTLPVGDFPAVLLPVARYGRMYVGHSNTRYVYVIRDSVTGIGEYAGERQRPRPELRVCPNPFRGSATIEHAGGDRADGRLLVCSYDGRSVARLEGSRSGAGSWSWDGRDQSGRPVPAGVYFLALEGDPARSTRVVKLK